MKILKHKNLVCLMLGHECRTSDIKNHYIGNGMYEFTHTCNRCGKKTTYELSEKALGLPERRDF